MNKAQLVDNYSNSALVAKDAYISDKQEKSLSTQDVATLVKDNVSEMIKLSERNRDAILKTTEKKFKESMNNFKDAYSSYKDAKKQKNEYSWLRNPKKMMKSMAMTGLKTMGAQSAGMIGMKKTAMGMRAELLTEKAEKDEVFKAARDKKKELANQYNTTSALTTEKRLITQQDSSNSDITAEKRLITQDSSNSDITAEKRLIEQAPQHLLPTSQDTSAATSDTSESDAFIRDAEEDKDREKGYDYLADKISAALLPNQKKNNKAKKTKDKKEGGLLSKIGGLLKGGIPSLLTKALPILGPALAIAGTAAAAWYAGSKIYEKWIGPWLDKKYAEDDKIATKSEQQSAKEASSLLAEQTKDTGISVKGRYRQSIDPQKYIEEALSKGEEVDETFLEAIVRRKNLLNQVTTFIGTSAQLGDPISDKDMKKMQDDIKNDKIKTSKQLSSAFMLANADAAVVANIKGKDYKQIFGPDYIATGKTAEDRTKIEMDRIRKKIQKTKEERSAKEEITTETTNTQIQGKQVYNESALNTETNYTSNAIAKTDSPRSTQAAKEIAKMKATKQWMASTGNTALEGAKWKYTKITDDNGKKGWEATLTDWKGKQSLKKQTFSNKQQTLPTIENKTSTYVKEQIKKETKQGQMTVTPTKVTPDSKTQNGLSVGEIAIIKAVKESKSTTIMKTPRAKTNGINVSARGGVAF